MTFSPLAWLKLNFFQHSGNTEVGGFGISAEDDLLYIQDFVTVRQTTSACTVEFADDAVADYFDACVDAGFPPARFGRVWCHTHPGSSAEPSSTDHETFARVFGSCDWSVMFIMGRTGRTYARLAFAAGPGGCVNLPVAVDWAAWPQTLIERGSQLGELMAAWMAEYRENVQPVRLGVETAAEEAELMSLEMRGIGSGLDDPFALQPSMEDLAPDPWDNAEPSQVLQWREGAFHDW